MDTTILVNELYEKGKNLIEALDANGLKFPVALWIKFIDRDSWLLLFGVPDLMKNGASETFAKIDQIIKEDNIQFSLSEISLDDVNSPLLKSLKYLISTNDAIHRIIFFENAINGQVFPDSIIYRCTT
jgi:hypothetical protein